MDVFIADDSILIRNVVRELLASDPSIKLVGEAANGADAVNKVLKIKPDIVIMDIDMPIMNGLEATTRIARESDIPVLVFTHNNDPELPFRALELGAVDFLSKPDFADLNKPDYINYFISKLRLLSRQKPKLNDKTSSSNYKQSCLSEAELIKGTSPKGSRLTIDLSANDQNRQADFDAELINASIFNANTINADIIVMGASTGGPQAVCSLLSQIVTPFPLPIVLVQHIETGFDKGYANWLAEESGHTVRLASSRLAPEKGIVDIAPTDMHLRLSKGNYILDDGQKVLNQKPSVDVLFQSAAELYGSMAIGVLLTGMGRDGALGCKLIRSNGGYTVVQDENSSLIFGMPKAAIEIGAASIILPLDKIALFLTTLAGKLNA